ncbi:MAG: DUF1698 domain-containing protein [Actinomycetota bacterium]|nr:DUF1698 domain-containing protein [Actinomycetota bacterium]
MAVTREALQAKVDAIRWYHTMDLGGGVVTAGENRTPEHLQKVGLPRDLRGRTVLDVGSWDGAFAFECERRGAARVLATDHFCWGGEGWGTKAGFDLAKSALGSRIEERELDVLDLTPESVGTFDVVLCLGVLYHMRHPFLVLERMAALTERTLIVETVVDLVDLDRPAIAFYPGSELADDPTNWHGPNPAAMHGMLAALAFTRIECVVPPWVDDQGNPLLQRLDAGDFLGIASRDDVGGEVGRMTFHAAR